MKIFVVQITRWLGVVIVVFANLGVILARLRAKAKFARPQLSATGQIIMGVSLAYRTFIPRLPAASQGKPWMLYDLNDDRAVLFRAAFFRNYLADLANILGRAVAEEMLYRLGLNIGRSMRSSEFTWDVESQFWESLNHTLQSNGWGSMVRHDSSAHSVEIEVEDSAVAEVEDRRATCHLLRGLFAGWLNADGHVSESREVECKSANFRFCKFTFELGRDRCSLYPYLAVK